MRPGDPSAFANFGWWVDFAAVGEGAVSTFVAGRESPAFSATPDDWTGQQEPVAQWAGTSFSAPKLAAAVANLCSTGSRAPTPWPTCGLEAPCSRATAPPSPTTSSPDARGFRN